MKSHTLFVVIKHTQSDSFPCASYSSLDKAQKTKDRLKNLEQYNRFEIISVPIPAKN